MHNAFHFEACESHPGGAPTCFDWYRIELWILQAAAFVRTAFSCAGQVTQNVSMMQTMQGGISARQVRCQPAHAGTTVSGQLPRQASTPHSAGHSCPTAQLCGAPLAARPQAARKQHQLTGICQQCFARSLTDASQLMRGSEGLCMVTVSFKQTFSHHKYPVVTHGHTTHLTL